MQSTVASQNLLSVQRPASRTSRGQEQPLLVVAPQNGLSLTRNRSLSLRTSRSHRASITKMGAKASSERYTSADQPARFAEHKRSNNVRALDIDKVYDPSSLKDKRVLVTGANRGIGLALVKELKSIGAVVIGTCRSSSKDLDDLDIAQIITGVDVTDTSCMPALVEALKTTGPVDVVVNNAGYFYEPVETIETLNFEEEMKMIDICAVGPLRVSAAIYNAGLVAPEGRIAMITSQGGSISWRDVQNPTGEDYGHHMSKAAANMMGKLLSQELKSKGITVTMLHPGFNKTDMTKKYEHIWEIEGAVDVSVGAKRTVHEIAKMRLEDTGKFINCEDGLEIPW